MVFIVPATYEVSKTKLTNQDKEAGLTCYNDAMNVARKKKNLFAAVKVCVGRRPYILILVFFVFLLLRNFSAFTLVDTYDGAIVKIDIIKNGTGIEGFKDYLHNYVFTTYSQHFLPVWFLIFYGISVIADSNPVVMGALSFGVTSCILFLIYRIVLHFNQRKSIVYGLFATLLFSSSLFFLEMISWKWMLCLLLSVCLALLCFFIILVKAQKSWWRYAYVLSLAGSVWTFGTSWVVAWGLFIFLLLKRDKNRLILPTLVTALLSTFFAWWLNRADIGVLNIASVIVNLPSLAVMITANIVLQLIGVFRFTALNNIYVSSVLGITSIAALSSHFFARYRHKLFNEKDSLIASLLMVYLATIALGITRHVPPHGLRPAASLDGYVFGNRYLFAYSIPLFLALALSFSNTFDRLKNRLVLIIFTGAMVLGFIVQLAYPKIDPLITNPSRTRFYYTTPAAVSDAISHDLVLPNIDGDLLSAGQTIPLEEAIKVRKDSRSWGNRTKPVSQLYGKECSDLRKHHVIVDWLNLYNTDWCR